VEKNIFLVLKNWKKVWRLLNRIVKFFNLNLFENFVHQKQGKVRIFGRIFGQL